MSTTPSGNTTAEPTEPGDQRQPGIEAPMTLTQPAPRTLGLLDQLGFWGNLGVSLLGFAGALSILTPFGAGPLNLPAAVTAIVVGSALGGIILGISLVLGAKTGAPAMVLLRGLLGAKASFVPTVLNIAQCLGWAVFELLVISAGLEALTGGQLPRWACVLAAGAVTTALTIWPLGSDYSRHSRTSRAAFAGGFLGYGATQIACLLLGVVALSQVQQNPDQIFDLFLAVPLGTAAFAILVLRETDQSFANVYSTAVSIQNMAPRWDRRILTVGIGTLAVVAALTIDISQYTNFLYLIGAVFIPLSGAALAATLPTP